MFLFYSHSPTEIIFSSIFIYRTTAVVWSYRQSKNKMLFVFLIASYNIAPPVRPQSLHNVTFYALLITSNNFSSPCRLPQPQVGYPALFFLFNRPYQSTLNRLHFLKRKGRNRWVLLAHSIVSVLYFLSASSIQVYFFLLSGQQQMSASITSK